MAGNPRFDILRPSLFPHRAPSSAGRQNVILFNSRFATVNPYSPVPLERRRQVRLAKYGLSGRDTPAGRAIDRWFEHQKEAFGHCRKLVEALAKAFPERAMVVRPHPSEGRKAWEEVAGRYPNCVVRAGGSALDDILQADVLVHNSCTTAIEANLLGVPTINFLPNFDEIGDNYLTNLIGPKCHDIPSAIEAVKTTELGGKEEIVARSTAARGKYAAHIAGLDRTESSDTILDGIDGLRIEAEPWSWRLRTLSNDWTLQLKQSVKEMLSAGKPNPLHLAANKGYHKQKFAETDEQEVTDALSRLGLGPHRVERFADQWFWISAREN